MQQNIREKKTPCSAFVWEWFGRGNSCQKQARAGTKRWMRKQLHRLTRRIGKRIGFDKGGL